MVSLWLFVLELECEVLQPSGERYLARTTASNENQPSSRVVVVFDCCGGVSYKQLCCQMESREAVVLELARCDSGTWALQHQSNLLSTLIDQLVRSQ